MGWKGFPYLCNVTEAGVGKLDGPISEKVNVI